MKRSKYAALRCYHSIPLEQVSYTAFDADPKYSDDEYFIRSYRWAERKIGFYPIFVACGNDESEKLTGYRNQWSVYLGHDRVDDEWVKVYRRKGEFPNNVLFVFPFEALPKPVAFTDYDCWHIVLNTDTDKEDLSVRNYRSVFRPSWSDSDWLRRASRNPFDVQLLVPGLDLRKACEIWVRNRKTKRKLEKMGFSNVIVKRLPCHSW